MPDVQEGLTDVDSDAGFLAALAGAAGVEVSEERLAAAESEDRSVSAGLTDGLTSDEKNDQPRDEKGQFASSEPVAPESSEGEPEAEPVQGQPVEGEPELDPAVTRLLEQNGGDAAKALAALAAEHANAQSFIGKQSQEVRDARERLARMEGQLETLMESGSSPSELPLLGADDQTVEQLEGLYERFGARGMMERVIEARPELIDTAIEVWHADDPLAAQRFAVRYDSALAEGTRATQAAEPAVDPVMDGIRQQAVFAQAVDSARASLSIPETEWSAIRDQVIPAFEDPSTSPLIKNAVVSDDPATRQQGMEALLQAARTRAISAVSAEATAQAAAAAATAAAERKQAATVTTGSLRPAERQPGEEMTTEERTKKFHESLLGTETTSVEEGLRQGRPA
jgi:hypothetical protein